MKSAAYKVYFWVFFFTKKLVGHPRGEELSTASSVSPYMKFGKLKQYSKIITKEMAKGREETENRSEKKTGRKSKGIARYKGKEREKKQLALPETLTVTSHKQEMLS